MKIYIENYEPDRQGGGWSFQNNLVKAVPDLISTYEESDIYFVTSPSMVQREQVDKAKEDGKKIVLRIDNAVRNSRNRNTGMSRMKDFAEKADLVIYQSMWAKKFLGDMLLKKDGVVIYNGVDTKIFNKKNRIKRTDTKRFLYSRVNRDETKNWEMARFIYMLEHADEKQKSILNIAGAFSPELIEYNFDFYLGEEYRYWGVVKSAEEMASIYKQTDTLIFTFFNDACSNTLIEALCSGCRIMDHFGMLDTGGSGEIFNRFNDKGAKFFSLKRMGDEYKKAFEELLNG